MDVHQPESSKSPPLGGGGVGALRGGAGDRGACGCGGAGRKGAGAGRAGVSARLGAGLADTGGGLRADRRGVVGRAERDLRAVGVRRCLDLRGLRETRSAGSGSAGRSGSTFDSLTRGESFGGRLDSLRGASVSFPTANSAAKDAAEATNSAAARRTVTTWDMAAAWLSRKSRRGRCAPAAASAGS